MTQHTDPVRAYEEGYTKGHYEGAKEGFRNGLDQAQTETQKVKSDRRASFLLGFYVMTVIWTGVHYYETHPNDEDRNGMSIVAGAGWPGYWAIKVAFKIHYKLLPR